MGFSLSKLFKPKTIIDASELLAQIDYKEGTIFGENSTNKIYIDIEELGGFPYLKTVVFGVKDIRIKKNGSTITFIFKNEEITLQSDNTQIESNQIHKSGVFYTPIDFELDENEAKKIKSNKIIEVKYTFNKHIISCKPTV
jgi:hypothetical protein